MTVSPNPPGSQSLPSLLDRLSEHAWSFVARTPPAASSSSSSNPHPFLNRVFDGVNRHAWSFVANTPPTKEEKRKQARELISPLFSIPSVGFGIADNLARFQAKTNYPLNSQLAVIQFASLAYAFSQMRNECTAVPAGTGRDKIWWQAKVCASHLGPLILMTCLTKYIQAKNLSPSNTQAFVEALRTNTPLTAHFLRDTCSKLLSFAKQKHETISPQVAEFTRTLPSKTVTARQAFENSTFKACVRGKEIASQNMGKFVKTVTSVAKKEGANFSANWENGKRVVSDLLKFWRKTFALHMTATPVPAGCGSQENVSYSFSAFPITRLREDLPDALFRLHLKTLALCLKAKDAIVNPLLNHKGKLITVALAAFLARKISQNPDKALALGPTTIHKLLLTLCTLYDRVAVPRRAPNPPPDGRPVVPPPRERGPEAPHPERRRRDVRPLENRGVANHELNYSHRMFPATAYYARNLPPRMPFVSSPTTMQSTSPHAASATTPQTSTSLSSSASSESASPQTTFASSPSTSSSISPMSSSSSSSSCSLPPSSTSMSTTSSSTSSSSSVASSSLPTTCFSSSTTTSSSASSANILNPAPSSTFPNYSPSSFTFSMRDLLPTSPAISNLFRYGQINRPPSSSATSVNNVINTVFNTALDFAERYGDWWESEEEGDPATAIIDGFLHNADSE